MGYHAKWDTVARRHVPAVGRAGDPLLGQRRASDSHRIRKPLTRRVLSPPRPTLPAASAASSLPQDFPPACRRSRQAALRCDGFPGGYKPPPPPPPPPPTQLVHELTSASALERAAAARDRWGGGRKAEGGAWRRRRAGRYVVGIPLFVYSVLHHGVKRDRLSTPRWLRVFGVRSPIGADPLQFGCAECSAHCARALSCACKRPPTCTHT